MHRANIRHPTNKRPKPYERITAQSHCLASEVPLAIYDTYVGRERIAAGVSIKRRQASIIFKAGIDYALTDASSVLEIGPGDGYIAEHCRDAHIDYIAVEGSDSVSDKLTTDGYSVVRGYVPPLPVQIKDQTFSTCFLLHVLEHMTSAQQAAHLLAEIATHLLPGGSLVIACPDYSRWGHYFYDCDYTHAFPVTRRRLMHLLRDQGLELVHHTIYVGPIFGYHGLPLAWIAKLLYSPLLDDLIGPHRFRDIMNRGFLSLLPNILTIARRPAI